MKKLLILLLTLSLVITANAQFGYGVKVGGVISHVNLDIPLVFTNTPQYGILIGAWFDIGKSKDYNAGEVGLSFQPELYYIQKGVKINDDLSEKYFNARLNYLEIPLFIKSTIYLKPVNIVFLYGIYGAVLLGDRYKTQELENYTIELRNGLLDGGLIGSVGVEFNSILIEFKASTGLVNVAEKTDGFYDDSRNNYVSLSVGYIIK